MYLWCGLGAVKEQRALLDTRLSSPFLMTQEMQDIGEWYPDEKHCPLRSLLEKREPWAAEHPVGFGDKHKALGTFSYFCLTNQLIPLKGGRGEVCKQLKIDVLCSGYQRGLCKAAINPGCFVSWFNQVLNHKFLPYDYKEIPEINTINTPTPPSLIKTRRGPICFVWSADFKKPLLLHVTFQES